jgi:hypothetical protein
MMRSPARAAHADVDPGRDRQPHRRRRRLRPGHPARRASIFYAAGRHPLAGIAAAFAGVSGGFSANPIPSSLDPLLQGLTQQATAILDPSTS